MVTLPLNFLGQTIFCVVGLKIVKICTIYLCFAVILIIVYKSTFIVLKVFFTKLYRYINIVTLINKFTTIITTKQWFQNKHLTKIIKNLHFLCLFAYKTVTIYFNNCTIPSVAGSICLYWVSEPKPQIAVAGTIFALEIDTYIVIRLITKRTNLLNNKYAKINCVITIQCIHIKLSNRKHFIRFNINWPTISSGFSDARSLFLRVDDPGGLAMCLFMLSWKLSKISLISFVYHKTFSTNA